MLYAAIIYAVVVFMAACVWKGSAIDGSCVCVYICIYIYVYICGIGIICWMQIEDLHRGLSIGGGMVQNFMGLIVTYDFYPVRMGGGGGITFR